MILKTLLESCTRLESKLPDYDCMVLSSSHCAIIDEEREYEKDCAGYVCLDPDKYNEMLRYIEGLKQYE